MLVIKKRFYILATFLFFAILQNGYSQSKLMRFEHLTTESGLPRNQVYSLMQDKVGYIWVGTGVGLSRYDGYRFRTYNEKNSNLSGKLVTYIYEDKKSILWIATDKGFSKFDRSNGRFENFTLSSEKLFSHATNILEDHTNQFWVGSKKGLFKFNREERKLNKNWSNHPLKLKLEESEISTLFQDSKNRLWVGTIKNGLFLITLGGDSEIENINNYKHLEKDNTTISNDRVDDIKEDANGNIWIATRGGLNKFNDTGAHNPKIITFQKIHNPFKSDVTYFDMLSSITIDQNNNLFIGYLNGLYYLPHGNDMLEDVDIITDNPQLKHNYGMKSQFIDKSGVLWLTSTNGIYKHDLSLLKFKSYRANQDEPESSRKNQVWSILKDKDNQVWLGTSFGLNKLVWLEQAKKYEYVHFPNNAENRSIKNKNSIISMLEYDDTNLLIIKRNGLFKFNKEKSSFTKLPFPENIYPKNMCLGEGDDIWIGTNKGVLRYKISTSKYKLYPLSIGKGYKKNNWTHVVYRDKENRIWIGTSSGINVFYPEEEKSYYFDSNQTNEYTSVWSIHSDNDGSIWYGKWGDGVTHIIPNKQTGKFTAGYTVENFYTKDGLANDYVYSVLSDNDDNLWMSTNKGISKLNKKTFLFENYTAEEGLQSNEFNSGAYYKAEDGELFFGGSSGMNSFYPSTISKNSVIPNIVITDIIVNGQELENKSSKVVLNYNQNPLKFEYSSLDFSNSSKNKYKIRLENYDDSWVNMNNNTSVTYSKLPPGKYSFHVKGTNHDGFWNEEVVSINIEIKPPYWETWWFYTLCAFLLVFVIVLVFNAQLKQMRLKEKNEYIEKENEEKKAVIKETHHRIKNNLQVVISLLRMQSSKIKDEEVVEMFKEAQKRILSMAMLHEKMQQKDDREGINAQEHFEGLINGLVKSYVVDKTINLDLKIDKIDIGMEKLIPLGLMVNEVITNSLKHAFVNKNNGLITVHIKQCENDSFEMLIGDDGVGFNSKAIPHGSGLGTKLIEIFIKQLNGSIKLLNQEGTMYKVVFQK